MGAPRGTRERTGTGYAIGDTVRVRQVIGDLKRDEVLVVVPAPEQRGAARLVWVQRLGVRLLAPIGLRPESLLARP